MFDNLTRIYTSTINNSAEQARFNERLREIQQLGMDKRLKQPTNRFTQIVTEKRSERY